MQPDTIKEKIISSVQDCVKGQKKVGVLFSGGLDSSVIARIASTMTTVTCYCAGVRGSHDVLFAERAADAMGLKLREMVLREKEVAHYAQEVSAVLKTNDHVQVGVGVPLYACCEAAQEKVMLSGTGADEIFGGYARFKSLKGKELGEELAKSFEKMLAVDAQRDTLIGKAAGKMIKMPYVEAGLTPLGEVGKQTLRKIALELDVPRFVAEHPKKAAQYGSGVDRLLKNLL